MSAATATGPDIAHKSVKELVANIAALLPADATWEDVQYHIEICQSIERGLEDIRHGRVVPAAEVWARLGLGDRP